MIVTDSNLLSLGLLDELLLDLDNNDIKYKIYDSVKTNPTISVVESGYNCYQRNKCDSIIAFGGGSPIDVAKSIGAKVARPDKNLREMKGLLKIRKEIPPLFAIPTTAGSGSEATLSSVITDSENSDKYAINDPVLIPNYAILDPVLTVELTPHLTAITGLDALTHAIEAYIGKNNTEETKRLSRQAVKLIFNNIYLAYKDGDDLQARKNMLKASYYAGLSFTRAYVGYVHAMAHSLGGYYDISHGLANSVILPTVLDFYGENVHNELAELSRVAGLSTENQLVRDEAEGFINSIIELNQKMNIPLRIEEINRNDIPELAKRAIEEANPLYPVPEILTENDMKSLFHEISRADNNS